MNPDFISLFLCIICEATHVFNFNVGVVNNQRCDPLIYSFAESLYHAADHCGTTTGTKVLLVFPVFVISTNFNPCLSFSNSFRREFVVYGENMPILIVATTTAGGLLEAAVR